MSIYHDIKAIHFEGSHLVLTIDGNEKKFNISDISAALEHASNEEKNTYEISPSGYGIHWPLLDEDISIDGLLGNPPLIKSKTKTA